MGMLELFACHMNVCFSSETLVLYLVTPLTTSYQIEMQFKQYDSHMKWHLVYKAGKHIKTGT